MLKPYLETGKITGTHGIRGDLRVDPWCDDPSFLIPFKTLYLDPEGKSPLAVASVHPHGRMVLLHVRGVDTVEQAETLRGKVLYLDRKDAALPAGTVFVQDLIGCRVTDADTGRTLGILSDITSGVANPYWTVTDGGREYLVPALDSVVVAKDPENGVVTIRPMKGIFDDEN